MVIAKKTDGQTLYYTGVDSPEWQWTNDKQRAFTFKFPKIAEAQAKRLKGKVIK